MTFRTFTGALPLVVLAGGAMASGVTEYRCGPLGDGEYRVFIAPEAPDEATAFFVMGVDSGGTEQEFALKAAPTGSGFRYVGPEMEFSGKGDRGVMLDGSEEVPCALVSSGDGGGAARRYRADGVALLFQSRVDTCDARRRHPLSSL